jgi:hypothetical protein
LVSRTLSSGGLGHPIDNATITAQNRRGEIRPANHAMGARSFSPYLKLLFLQVDTVELKAMLEILSPAG